MAYEIERKFLVKNDLWKDATIIKSNSIKQAYLSLDPEKTVRVRTNAGKGYITVKGKTQGISRLEYEYEIPLGDANEMIKLCTSSIEKTRHYILFEGKTWELDVFEGNNAGLIVAEIELKSEDENFNTPEWIGKEVSDDIRYANSKLMLTPFNTWK